MKKADPRAQRGPRRPCCMISEILEEAGLDRERARELRRQVLQGVILLCQWQLERLEQSAAADVDARPAGRAARARKVEVD